VCVCVRACVCMCVCVRLFDILVEWSRPSVDERFALNGQGMGTETRREEGGRLMQGSELHQSNGTAFHLDDNE
jgi:hypothetical protein